MSPNNLASEAINSNLVLSVKVLYWGLFLGVPSLTATIIWIVKTLYMATIELGNLKESNKELRGEVKALNSKYDDLHSIGAVFSEKQLDEFRSLKEILIGMARKGVQ